MNTDYIYLYWGGIIYNKIINKKCGQNSYIMMKSITKFFVSIAISIMVYDGIISYNDPINKFYPKFKYPKITILDILTHKSGLENKWSLIIFTYVNIIKHQ